MSFLNFKKFLINYHFFYVKRIYKNSDTNRELMEKISLIKKDLQEKSGKEWLGLQKQTENRLESLVWYLDHPKLQESPRLVEEIVQLYYMAKKTNFIKMEGIIRKLDQLSIKFSKEGVVKKTAVAQSHSARGEQVIYAKAIEEFKQQVDDFLSSSSGMGLSEKTKKSLITFLGFLNHPDLVKKTALYEDMREKYDGAEEQDFLSMSAFDDMLNKCEIKLGAITDKLKAWKSPEERKQELDAAWEKFEAEKELFQEKLKNLEIDQEEMKVKREELETEKNQMDKERENLKIECEALKVEKQKMETKKNRTNNEREDLKIEREAMKLEKEKRENENSQIEKEREDLKNAHKKIEDENERLNQERAKFEAEREELKIKQENTEAKKEKLDRELAKLESEGLASVESLKDL